MTLALFLTESAVGSLLALLLLPPRQVGRKFFRFAAGLCCLLVILGGVSSPGHSGGALSTLLFGATAILLLASAGTFHLGRPSAGFGLMAVSCAPGLAGVALDALGSIPAGDPSAASRLLYPLDAVTSGLLVGSALIAMILGHDYLNVPGLSIRHLQRLTAVFMAAVGIRAVVVAISVVRNGAALRPLVALLLDTQRRELPSAGLDPYALVFLLVHLVFGAAASGIMSVMAWRTSLISSTQSTTGILYVALLMTMMGELASRYLLTLTGLPL